jgi:hypothetical protein
LCLLKLLCASTEDTLGESHFLSLSPSSPSFPFSPPSFCFFFPLLLLFWLQIYICFSLDGYVASRLLGGARSTEGGRPRPEVRRGWRRR